MRTYNVFRAENIKIMYNPVKLNVYPCKHQFYYVEKVFEGS